MMLLPYLKKLHVSIRKKQIGEVSLIIRNKGFIAKMNIKRIGKKRKTTLW